MPMFQYITFNQMQDSRAIVQAIRPELVELIDEVNDILCSSKDGLDSPQYAVNAVEYEYKKWPWSKPIAKTKIQLLFGVIREGSNEMQVLHLPHSPEALLYGFLNCHRTQKEYVSPEVMWDRFIRKLNCVDLLTTKSFLGSTERYRKIFLDANDGSQET